MSSLMIFLASACAAISVTAFSLIFFNLLQMVEIEKVEQTEDTKQLPILFRFFMPLVPNVLPLARSGILIAQRDHCKNLIGMGGYELAINAEQFLAIRILMAVFGVILMILFLLSGQTASGLLILMLFLIYPMTWLRGVVRRRHLSILKALPNVLDLLTLSVEAGKDFLTALRDIIARRKMDPLGEELARTLHEIQLGKNRQGALKEMAMRVQQPELTSVVNAIIQADELGVSIGQLLRIQGDQLRMKRFARAEKLANEASTKILMPVILFIFPAVFLFLMGPILLQAAKTIFQ